MKYKLKLYTFTCPSCGQTQTRTRRRCYRCTGFKAHTQEARERIRRSLTGVPHDAERRRKNSEGHKDQADRFDIREWSRTHPHPFAKPVGASRPENGHIKVKCEDGNWRYRARLTWEAANGPIPAGRLVHHRNEDPFDDRLENLQMVTRAEHARIHMEARIRARVS